MMTGEFERAMRTPSADGSCPPGCTCHEKCLPAAVETTKGGDKVIDLMAALKESLRSKNA